MFEELRSILFAVKQRRGEWRKATPAMTVPDSEGLLLLERYYEDVK